MENKHMKKFSKLMLIVIIIIMTVHIILLCKAVRIIKENLKEEKHFQRGNKQWIIIKTFVEEQVSNGVATNFCLLKFHLLIIKTNENCDYKPTVATGRIDVDKL